MARYALTQPKWGPYTAMFGHIHGSSFSRKGRQDMKSERRHELQHNTLAEWLFKAGQGIKPYQNLVTAAIVVLILLAFGLTIWSRTSATRTATAWTDLTHDLESENLDGLASLAEKSPGTNVGNMAALVTADMRLSNACTQRFSNKALAMRELREASKSYSDVLKESRSPMMLERATFGLARADEAQGDLDSAKKHYGEVVANWPKGAYAPAAKQRLDDFARRETKMMFDSLASFDPKPSFSEQPDTTLMPNFSTESVPEEKPLDALTPGPATKDEKKPATKADDKKEKPAAKVDGKKTEKGEKK
jgi:hypothetical protein